MRFKIVMALLVLALVAAAIAVTIAANRADAAEGKWRADDPGAAILRLEARVKELEGKVPNQAIVMTHLAYHFTNLWFAARDRDWPLAGFYLGEVRDNLKWAARVHPVRQGPAGEVNVAGIAEAVDNTELAKLAQAIHERRNDAFDRAYDETLTACLACHQAIGKPYLRLERPTSPEAHIIRFDQAARAR
jgi:hypothetical protein